MSTSPNAAPVQEDPEDLPGEPHSDDGAPIADDSLPGLHEPEPETPDNYAQAGPDETPEGQPIDTEADGPGSMGGDNGGG